MAATQLGKRYECAVCQTVVMCLSAGPEPFMCCDRPMEEGSWSRSLPATDPCIG